MQGALTRQLRTAECVLASCRRWLDALPEDVELESVEIVPPPDATLADVREKLKAAQAEIATLRRSPVPWDYRPGVALRSVRVIPVT